MYLFLFLVVFWSLALTAGNNLRGRWRRWNYRQPARTINEIRNVEYFRRLSSAQFESLLMQVFKVRKFTMFDDPYLDRSKKQGYAWKAGKKAVVVYCPEKPLTPAELSRIAKRQRLVRAEQALVFSPFRQAPRVHYPGLEVLAGDKLLAWFSALDTVVPPLAGEVAARRCDCDAPMRKRVNRAGRPLLVCSRFPDCGGMREPFTLAS